MTGFSDDFGAAALDDHLAEFGEVITYFPSGEMSRSITVAVRHDGTQLENDRHHKTERRTVTLLAKRDATEGFVRPVYGDAVRLAGEADESRWTFDGIVAEDDAAVAARFAKRVGRRGGFSEPASL